MSFQRLKNAIDVYWVKHVAFRVAFIVAFLFSLIAVSIYAFFVFRPYFGLLVPVFLSVYYVRKYRFELQVGFRSKYWWLPLILSVLYMAFFSYHNYTTDRIDYFVFSAALCLISIGFLTYYSTRKGAGDR